MNCPICGGPMGFSEASALGNCLRCEDGPMSPFEKRAYLLLALILVLGLLLVRLVAGLE